MISETVAAEEVDDRRILTAWRSGDGGSLELLYRGYAGRLRRYCRKRLSDAAEAEDACHESILKAHAALPRFREGAGIWPWLVTIAGNVCIDIQRHKAYASVREEVEGGAEDFEQVFEERVRAALVRSALFKLPGSYRTHIYLRDFRGFTYDEISRTLDTSVASVRSTLLRARRALKGSIREVAKEQGQWPLPALAPLGLPRSRWTLSGWVKDRWNELIELIRSLLTLDPAALCGFLNAVALAIIIGIGPMQAAADASLRPEPRNSMGASHYEESPTGNASQTSVAVIRTVDAEAKAYEAGSSSAIVDLPKERRSGILVGPVRVDCSPNPEGTTEETVCLLLSKTPGN